MNIATLYVISSMILGMCVHMNCDGLSSDQRVPCPVHLCNCTKHLAECSNHGTNLTYFPDLPKSVRKLSFAYNWLPNLTKDTFEPLKKLQLQELSLPYNNITYISKDAFEVLPHLKYLYLGNNVISINVLKDAFYGLRNSKVQRLFLPHMELPDLPPDMFLNLQNSSVREIQMYFNKFQTLDGSVYRYLPKLRSLHIPNNYIKSVNFDGLQHIKYLYLRWNYQTDVPGFCNSSQISFLPNLKVLDLGHNKFSEISKADFPGHCLPQLRNLSVDENYLRVIEDNTFSDLPLLERLSLTWMRSNNLHFSSYAFNSSSVEYLYISNHMVFLKEQTDIRNIFQYCPNLKVLDMTKIRLTYLSAEEVYELFRPLRKLTKLVLQSTSLLNVPDNLFPTMPNLKNLNFKNCLIHGWSENTFKNMSGLEILYLDHNKIATINDTSFPKDFLKSLQKLSLNVNPFTCTCDLYWFRQWIKENKEKLLHFPRSYTCYSPSEWTGRRLVTYNPTYNQCHPISPYIILGIVLSMVLLVLFVAGVSIYRYRWHIKYYIYLMRSRKGYERIQGDDGFVYDAFVAYHAHDRAWVISELLPHLEKREKIRLCLHDRDFDVGRLIVDNIVEKIQKSRKIILILSNNFAKSQWCQFETMMAQNRLMDEGGTVLLLVMLETIKSRCMSNSLHVLLTSTTFIEWAEDGPGRELFWKRLIACLKSSN